MTAELIAYVQGSSNPLTLGNLMSGGTLTICGETYDIPPNTRAYDHPAPERIAEALEQAGYRLAADYVYAVEIPDRCGVFPARVVKA